MDVLRHGHWLDQFEVLVDHSDTSLNCLGRSANVLQSPVDSNLADVCPIYAGKNVGERCLSSTILT